MYKTYPQIVFLLIFVFSLTLCVKYVTIIRIFESYISNNNEETIMLTNTKYKLTDNNSLRIAFFGGSITDGTGASDAENTSYRAIVTQWFKKQYPDAQIITKNASIGGTGTSLGMFRCQKDALSFEPDLIFMEYAVNDEGDTYENIALQTESIIRTVIKHDPMTDIIAVITTGEPMLKYMQNGKEADSVTAQTDIANYYGIPLIKAGNSLLAQTAVTSLTMHDLIPDGLHPNDSGHKIYAESVIKYIAKCLDNCSAKAVPHVLPDKLYGNASDNARLVDIGNADDLVLNGFEFKNSIKDNRFNEYIEGTHPGDSFSFTFEGTRAAFYWMGGGVSCDVTVCIDGGEPFTARSWDHYVRSFHKMQAATFAKDLAFGTHTVKVTIPQNTSNSDIFARIAGIMIA